jgi:hypothetical protein
VKPYIQATSNKTIQVPEGSSVYLYCIAEGAPRPTVIWGNDNHLNIGGRVSLHKNNIDQYTINSSLHISNTISSDSGNYKCTAATDNGTTTETFQLTVYIHIPETPELIVTSSVINSTSIEISWTVFNVPQEAHVKILWSIYNICESNPFTAILPQNTSSFIITYLLPNTSYIINVTATDISSIIIITTHPLIIDSVTKMELEHLTLYDCNGTLCWMIQVNITVNGSVCIDRIDNIQLNCTDSNFWINSTDVTIDPDDHSNMIVTYTPDVDQTNNSCHTFTPNVINSVGDMDHYDVAITISNYQLL